MTSIRQQKEVHVRSALRTAPKPPARRVRRYLALLFAGLLALPLVACSSDALSDVADDDPIIEVLETAENASLAGAADSTSVRSLDGSTVSGEIIVSVRSRRSIDRVAFELSNEARDVLLTDQDSQVPYQLSLDTRAYPDGNYRLKVETLYHRRGTRTKVANFMIQNGGSGDTDVPSEPEVPSDPDTSPNPEDPTDATSPEAPTEPTDPTAPTDPTSPTDPNEPTNPTDPETPAEPETPTEPTDPIVNPEPPTTPEVFEATYYVATNGSDSNDGRTIERPFRTVQRAADVVQPGDVVAIRGGVYSIRATFYRNGTASQPIRWTSYPGEWAVFDGSDQTPVESNHRISVSADWNQFENFEVRYGPLEGIIVNGGHDNVFRNLDVHHNHNSGILNYQSDRNLYEDLLVHDNYDRYNPYGRIGDDADGIGISTGTGNVIRRVIAYRNSDDGIDTWRSTYTLVEAAVAWGNGLGEYGNGNGIKAGGNNETVYTVVRNSISFQNRSHGFDYNSGKEVVFYNNTAFDNGSYAFVAGDTTTLRNNIAVGSPAGLWGADSAFNNWDLGISDPRFVSTDPSSPDFLTLRSDSLAIDAGINVGIAYTGSAPDLGAFADGRDFASLIDPEGIPELSTASASLP